MASAISPAAQARHTSSSSYLVAALLLYVVLCCILRFRRRDELQRHYKISSRASLAGMTNVQAQEILASIAELEFPKMYEMSIQFALFKTYGIPTISKLLVATKEFSTPETAGKRYADTEVLIREFSSHHPKSPRVISAIARMNYVHSHYQKSGKITNDDLLYTLSVFVTEPIDWIAKYEWRPLTDIEVCAIATFWKSIGDAMGIGYGATLGKTEWGDGLEFHSDIKAWAEAYEVSNMVPAATNKKTADELIPLLLFYVPRLMRGPATQMVAVLMGDRLRESMMYSTPPKGYVQFVQTVFGIRRFFLRYLSLPRPEFMRGRKIDDVPDRKTGRYYVKGYQAFPYYNKPQFLNRWGPEGWFVWLAGGHVPGSSDEFGPEGFKFEEVGPKKMKNKGAAEMKVMEEMLQSERPLGCPFAFAR